MKHITILYPEGQCTLSTIDCIIGTVEVLSKAQNYWLQKGNVPKYKIVVAGTNAKAEYIKGLVAIKPDANLSEIDQTDLVIIPSAMPRKNSKNNEEMIGWINRQYKAGAEIASMCSGAFILTSTGIIMDGRNCSTHWMLTDTFREIYLKVNLQADNLITD